MQDMQQQTQRIIISVEAGSYAVASASSKTLLATSEITHSIPLLIIGQTTGQIALINVDKLTLPSALTATIQNLFPDKQALSVIIHHDSLWDIASKNVHYSTSVQQSELAAIAEINQRTIVRSLKELRNQRAIDMTSQAWKNRKNSVLVYDPENKAYLRDPQYQTRLRQENEDPSHLLSVQFSQATRLLTGSAMVNCRERKTVLTKKMLEHAIRRNWLLGSMSAKQDPAQQIFMQTLQAAEKLANQVLKRAQGWSKINHHKCERLLGLITLCILNSSFGERLLTANPGDLPADNLAALLRTSMSVKISWLHSKVQQYEVDTTLFNEETILRCLEDSTVQNLSEKEFDTPLPSLPTEKYTKARV